MRSNTGSPGGATAGSASSLAIVVDPVACDAFGYCAELLPELVGVDEWGYPVLPSRLVPEPLAGRAREAVRQCPRRAFLLRSAAT